MKSTVLFCGPSFIVYKLIVNMSVGSTQLHMKLGNQPLGQDELTLYIKSPSIGVNI